MGFLFTCDGLGLRLSRNLRMDAHVRDRLARVQAGDLVAFAPRGEPPGLFLHDLQAVAGRKFAGAGAPPTQSRGWQAARIAVSAVLDPLKLPRRGVILVGDGPVEGAWCPAAGLAKFLPHEGYFPPPQPTGDGVKAP